jgi:hypothetical protein
MKSFILFTLLTVIFVSPYAMAQVPSCPCDTLELQNGTTGNDIVELLCPGGSLSGDAVFELNENFVFIVSDSDTMGYEVESFPEGGVCVIGQEGSGNPNNETGLKLTFQKAADCRTSLIERCRLNSTPIPTLSEWGLIAMAGVLGIIGLIIAARRRKAAA